jgi:hypothetical protein
MNLLDFIFKPARRIETELTVSRMEALRKAASRAQPPDAIIGGKILGTESGWTLEIPQSTGGAVETQPHQVLSVGEDKITIRNGTINNLITLPINEVSHTKTDSYRYVVIDVTIDGENGVTGAEYKIESTPPDAFSWEEDEAPSSIKILIAILEGSKIFQITSGNKTVSRIVAHQIPKDSVSVGEYPNHIYYTYSVY